MTLNNSSTFVYDERGQVTQVIDALGKKTTQTYDVYGRPKSQQDAKQYVFGAAHVAIAVAQAIEQQVSEDIPGGEDGQRRVGGLHAGPPDPW